MRVLRLVRVGKVARIARMVRFFQEMRVLMSSIAGSFISMFWSFSLLSLIIFTFAIFFVQGFANFLSDTGADISKDDPGTLDSTLLNAIAHGYSSVGRAMLSLFMSATGGD